MYSGVGIYDNFGIIFSIIFNPKISVQEDSKESSISELDYKREAPNFSLQSLEGKNVELEGINDKILVFHIATVL